MNREKVIFSRVFLLAAFVIAMYYGVGQFVFKLVILNDKFDGSKSKVAFDWATNYIPNNISMFIGCLILLIIFYVLLEFINESYFLDKNSSSKLLKLKTDTFTAPRLVYKLIGVIVQLDFIYSAIVDCGVSSTGKAISQIYGGARYNAALALLGGGAKSIGGGGRKLGYIVLTLLFLYILTVTFIIDNFINRLKFNTKTKASHNTPVRDMPI